MSLSYLRSHTDYSLGRGASTVSDLISYAKKDNVVALALTDFNAMYGVKQFSDEALKAGIKPIIGINVTVKSEVCSGDVVLLAMSAKGYINICKLHAKQWEPYTDSRGKQKVHEDLFVTVDDLIEFSEDVIILSGNASSGFLYKFLGKKRLGDIRAVCGAYGDRFYVEMCRSPADDRRKIESELFHFADGDHGSVLCSDGVERDKWPVVATIDVWYAKAEDYKAYKILDAVRIGENAILNDSSSHDIPSHYLFDQEEFNTLFASLPEAVENAFSIAMRCNFYAPSRSPMLPLFGDGVKSEDDILIEMSRVGLEERLRYIPEEKHQEYRERLEFELSVIIKMKFPGYFLIVADFIQWAKQNDIPVGPGRGSGAGSLVAYSLTITDVDPIPHGLFFERFLNPERVSMPDFDIDFCTDRRDEVINYVRMKYGDEYVSMISTYGQINARSAIDIVQRVVVDLNDSMYNIGDAIKIKELLSTNPAEAKKKLQEVYDTDDVFRATIDSDDHLKTMLRHAQSIEGLKHHASTHAAGVIIGSHPLVEMFPVVRDPKTLTSVCGFDMKMAEKSGAVKFDFLGLKNLSIIKKTLDYIKEYRGEDVNISLIPMDDSDVYANMAIGRTVGVFQFSGGGMQGVLRQIKSSEFSDLVAATSLFRPGPMEQIPSYASRKLTGENIIYPVEKFTKPILQETYGIIVYQEQVMQIAQACAGYSLGGADLLRRAMGKKDAKAMAEQKSEFVNGCVKNDIDAKEAEDLFDMIAKFAEYGFNKSHAVAYSLISYQTMWLKVHYPECFYAALLSYDYEGDKVMLTEREMKNFNIRLLKPSVQHSHRDFVPEKLEEGYAVRYGFCAIKSVGTKDNFVKERLRGGDFKDVYDFFDRTFGMLSKADYERLIEAGCLDDIVLQSADWESFANKAGKVNRNKLARVFEWLVTASRKSKSLESFSMFDMFEDAGVSLQYTPPDVYKVKENGVMKDVPVMKAQEWENRASRELDSLGFYVNGHPILSHVGEIIKIGGRRLREANHFLWQRSYSYLGEKIIVVLVLSYEVLINAEGRYYIKFKVDDGSKAPVHLILWTNVLTKKTGAYEFTQLPSFRQFIDILEFSMREKQAVVFYGTMKRRKPNEYDKNPPCIFDFEKEDNRIGRAQSLEEYLSQTNAGKNLIVVLDNVTETRKRQVIDIVERYNKSERPEPFDPEITLQFNGYEKKYICGVEAVTQIEAIYDRSLIVMCPEEEEYYAKVAEDVAKGERDQLQRIQIEYFELEGEEL